MPFPPMREQYAKRLAGRWLKEPRKPPPCDHIRHQWRGVDLPCATPGCAEGSPVNTVCTSERVKQFEVKFYTFIRENWDGGWGWRLA